METNSHVLGHGKVFSVDWGLNACIGTDCFDNINNILRCFRALGSRIRLHKNVARLAGPLRHEWRHQSGTMLPMGPVQGHRYPAVNREPGRHGYASAPSAGILSVTIMKPVLRNVAAWLLLPFLALALLSQTCHAGELRVAAWNLEHLNDTAMEGCVPRERADYDAIGRGVVELDADIVAIQEVENEAAARRVFPAPDWHVEMSSRPATGPGRPCLYRPGARLGHLATGFAIRRGVAYRRNGDLDSLGKGDPLRRWGTDITVTKGGRDLRLLSVHLESGCWGSGQDRDNGREEICVVLRGQIMRLKAWADARRAEGEAFVILGDFNRRLAVPGDWGWRILSPPPAPLHLPTSGRVAQCDPRFREFIDHLVVGGGASAIRVAGSFREMPRHGPHPDHCAVSAEFMVGERPGEAGAGRSGE